MTLNLQTRFHVICKRSGQVVGKYYAQAFFYFHTINSYEENGHIVTDLMAYEDPTILEKWDLSAMRSNMYDEQNQATPTRFVMPLHVQPVSERAQLFVKFPMQLFYYF